MALPKIPEFDDLLGSLVLADPGKENFSNLPIVEDMVEVHSDGSRNIRKGSTIWYRTDTKLSMDSLLKKIKAELESITHPASDQIAKTILLLFISYREGRSGNVESINQILSKHNVCEASQYFILPDATGNDFVPISFGDFSIERLDARRFEYKCQKAGSDFFMLYRKDITDKPSIERRKYSTTVINSHELIEEVNYKYQDYFFKDTLLYFEAVSASLFESFWYDFNEQQNLHISAGLPVFQDRVLREKLRSQNVTIFTKLPVKGVHRGYVVPLQIGFYQIRMSYDLGPSIRRFYESIHHEYSFENFKNNEVHQTFKTFCRFVARAYRHLEENKMDEGFLHFIIALDLVFGDKNESTKSVGNRCALLTMTSQDSYSLRKKKISELYDIRSKYVHAGLSVKKENIEEAKEICKRIVYCFLRLQTFWSQKIEEFTIDQWKRKIDYACSAIEADETIAESLKGEIGIS